ncbi:hypothetical protein [Wolbachia endosymbiont of Chironomus riparius]|uniref:hypothetical protein n=1 Tax=Wolbachia endosymbiont of Chironomus riparius TaxID=2883238 RepID=UPI00209F84F4|nr:hypothetical protein [Wolbachia endosymbiont of Chironomus riparius]
MEFLKQKQQEAECNRDLDTKTCHPSIYLQYYSDAINAMEKYCSQDTDGKFRIEPYYLCINDALDEIQTNLNQIKETFDKRRNVNTNDITHGYLVKKAKLNEEIDFSICSDLPELTLEGCIAGPSITEANSKI